MKNVWILEAFETRERMDEVLNEFNDMLSLPNTDEVKAELVRITENHKNTISNNPNGMWYGFEGKVPYNQFIDVASDALIRNPDKKFRVVKAEIEDNAEYWLNYKNPVENPGVLRYIRYRNSHR